MLSPNPVILYTFSYTDENKNVVYNKGLNLSESVPRNKSISVDFDRNSYQSNIIIYTDRVSDIIHLISFNLYTEVANSITSIGSNINGKNNSPLEYENYKKLLDLIKIKNQVLNYNKSEDIYTDIDTLMISFKKSH